MRRARIRQKMFPGGQEVVQTYRTALRDARHSETQSISLFPLAEGNPELMLAWAEAVPAAVLDRGMPQILVSKAASSSLPALFAIWLKRGSADVAQRFAASNPALDLGFELEQTED